jgi:hypothetical protein
MSWLFSQALVEEYSAASCSDGEPYAQWSVMPTPQGFWRSDKMMEPSRLSQFGPTLQLLTADRGAELLMSFLAAFPAKTSAPPAKAPASMESAADYGEKWHALFAKWDRDLSGWKTPQCSLLVDLTLFSETWPRSGLMHDGECYQLQTLVRPMRGSGYGYLPTPTAQRYGNNQSLSDGAKVRPSLSQMAKLDLWPTPTATLGSKGGRITPRKSKEGGNLIEAISARANWPTPHGFSKDGRSNGPSGNELGRAVNRAMVATPQARDYKSGKFSPGGKSHRASQARGKSLSEQVGGSLNPMWVEWLMGWPLGWTDLKPLEMDKFQKWIEEHLIF